jgi:GH15 family glucan-1,4-alpha-glucosidase
MYGVVGNGETCAFISVFSSVDWLCIPAFDSPTVFARALDSVNGGSLTLSYEQGETKTPFERGEQRYLEDTNLLETTTRIGADTVRAVDFMPFGKRGLWRILGVSGPDPLRLTVDVDFRPNYNRDKPVVDALENGLIAHAPGQALLVASPEKATVKRQGITFKVEPQMTIPILLAYGAAPDEARKEAGRMDYERGYQADLK